MNGWGWPFLGDGRKCCRYPRGLWAKYLSPTNRNPKSLGAGSCLPSLMGCLPNLIYPKDGNPQWESSNGTLHLTEYGSCGHHHSLIRSSPKFFLSNSSLSPVRLGVDFVLPLSQQELQKQENPPTKNLSCYWPDFDDTLKVASWERLEQMLTVMATFVQATFVQVTFDHVRNISAVSDPILMKL